jgi:hypothetical protein
MRHSDLPSDSREIAGLATVGGTAVGPTVSRRSPQNSPILRMPKGRGCPRGGNAHAAFRGGGSTAIPHNTYGRVNVSLYLFLYGRTTVDY